MPIYEYLCSKCGQIEIFQRITEGPLTRCPTCQRKVTKLISQSSFHLKGSGWYVTDYARKGSGDTSKTKGSTASESSGEGSSPTKATNTGDAPKAAKGSKDGGSPSSSGKAGKGSGAGSAAA